jgi:SAM-dependent methyltransferase
MQRKAIIELLDDDLGTTEEIAASIGDLRHINHWFGGTRTTIAMLRRVALSNGRGPLSILEVGAGAGDVPLTARATLAKEGIELEVLLLDRRHSHLPAGRTVSIVGEARRLPFRDGSFDVVGCSLLAHHFGPDELKLFVCEALRVCRVAVLINDLIRSRLHLALVYLGLPLFRSRITRHDAPASVRQAYTVDEMRDLLAYLPVQRVEITRHYLYRMGALVWKRAQ